MKRKEWLKNTKRKTELKKLKVYKKSKGLAIDRLIEGQNKKYN